MYTRPHAYRSRSITVPQNYNGTAFTEAEADQTMVRADDSTESPFSEEAPCTSDAGVECKSPKNSFLPIKIDSEELLLIGLMIILFQSDRNDGLIPLLMAILFLGS